jgi:hypothetical protein
MRATPTVTVAFLCIAAAAPEVIFVSPHPAVAYLFLVGQQPDQ